MLMKMNLQFFAHKKGGGSTSNGRDSQSKRLGAKLTGTLCFPGQELVVNLSLE